MKYAGHKLCVFPFGESMDFASHAEDYDARRYGPAHCGNRREPDNKSQLYLGDRYDECEQEYQTTYAKALHDRRQ